MSNYKLVIEYDGSAYHGWQRQKGDRTIQAEIEAALSKMTGQKIVLIGSGRTDAGVHALGQTAGFRCDTNLSAEAFQRGLNSLTPADIVIRSCTLVPDGFHARYDVKSKLYRYRILNWRLPAAVGRQYCWFISRPLDIEAMRAGLGPLVGQHDFKAFEGTGSPRASSVRHVMRAELLETPEHEIHFEIEADGFLRFMVRNIVGTLVKVGQGKLAPDAVGRILASKERTLAGPTAPPQGLFLVSVRY